MIGLSACVASTSTAVSASDDEASLSTVTNVPPISGVSTGVVLVQGDAGARLQ
jgi:hypothetical protein